MKNKNWLYSLILLFIFIIIYLFNDDIKKEEKIIQGKTMGGINYTIKYLTSTDKIKINKKSIDSLLVQYNQSLSHYIPDSDLTILNKSKSIPIKYPYVYQLFKESKKIYQASEKAFNPAIGPLINYWGFGPTNSKKFNGGNSSKSQEKKTIDSLLYLSNYDFVKFDTKKIEKDCTYVQLNFSAIAKGQAVDILFDYVETFGIQDIYVNIGGECRVKGKNRNGKFWTIGIASPLDSNIASKSLISRVQLVNAAMATSGNYRNYKVIDGMKKGHIISPNTGYPTSNNILSVSIIAENCMVADAWATACMVNSLYKTKNLLQENKNLAAYIIYEQDEKIASYVSDNFKAYLIDELIP